MRSVRVLRLCSFLLALFLPSRLLAAPTEIRWECIALTQDDEARGAVEARALAELSLLAPDGGLLEIRCADGSAQVTFRRSTGGVGQSVEVRLSNAPRADVDILVDATWRAAQAPVPEKPAPPLPKPTPPLRASRSTSTPELRGLVWVGASAQIWQGAVQGWAGPAVGAGLTRRGWGTLVAGIGAHLGLERVSGLRVSTWDSRVVADASILGPLSVGLALELSLLNVEADASLAPQVRRSLLVGVGVRPRFELGGQRLRCQLGPELHYNALNRRVFVDGSQVFALPAFTVGIGAELALLL